MSKQKIILTGATGFLGSRCLHLLEKDFEILPFGRNTKISEIGSFKADYLIHTAAKSGHKSDQQTIPEYIESNITFPSLVLEAFVRSGGKKVLNIGSYWQHKDNKLKSPNSFYASTKEAFEDIIDHYVVNENLEAISLHLFDTYGPQDRRKKILNLVHEAALSHRPLDLSGGEQLLALTHVDDVVAAMKASLNSFSATHQKFFVRTQEILTLKEVVELYLKVNDLKATLNWGVHPYSPRDFFQKLDVLPDLPRWKAEVKLETGLKNLF